MRSSSVLVQTRFWLQVVEKSFGGPASPPTAGPRVDKKVVRAQRMEARNISDAEVKEALAAPARERRERAPRGIINSTEEIKFGGSIRQNAGFPLLFLSTVT